MADITGKVVGVKIRSSWAIIWIKENEADTWPGMFMLWDNDYGPAPSALERDMRKMWIDLIRSAVETNVKVRLVHPDDNYTAVQIDLLPLA